MPQSKPDLRAQCAVLAARGLTQGQIALKLGVTKNTVAGQMARGSRDRQQTFTPHGRAHLPRSAKLALAVLAGDIVDFMPHPDEPAPIGPESDLDGGCQWIHGTPSSGQIWRPCGHERQEGQPYCPHHFRRSRI